VHLTTVQLENFRTANHFHHYILDPNSSLVHSYLGKAYYEEKRDALAESQLKTAKELDPLDPTAWFYDAIRKQSTE